VGNGSRTRGWHDIVWQRRAIQYCAYTHFANAPTYPSGFLVTMLILCCFQRVFSSDVSSAIGIDSRRVQVTTIDEVSDGDGGGSEVNFMFLPPGPRDTGRAAMSAHEAAEIFMKQWADPNSPIRQSSVLSSADPSRGVSSQSVIECPDGGFREQCDSSSGGDNPWTRWYVIMSLMVGSIFAIMLLVWLGRKLWDIVESDTRKEATMQRSMAAMPHSDGL